MKDVVEQRFGSFPSMGERGISEVFLDDLSDVGVVESYRHGRNEFHEFWISFELIHTLALVTKTASFCVNDDQGSVPLSALDSAANSRLRLRRADILFTQLCERRDN